VTTSSATTSTTTPRATTTPATTASVTIPAAAKAHTKDGAEAFARFYYQQAATSAVRADSSSVAALSDDSCLGCDVFVETADELAAKQHHAEKPSLTIKLVSYRSGGLDAPVVDVACREEAIRIVDSAGGTVETYKPGVITFKTGLRWTMSGWRVKDIEVL
jgi:hypothetical protein